MSAIAVERHLNKALKLLKDCPSTIDELAEFLQLSRSQTWPILMALESAKKIHYHNKRWTTR